MSQAKAPYQPHRVEAANKKYASKWSSLYALIYSDISILLVKPGAARKRCVDKPLCLYAFRTFDSDQPEQKTPGMTV